MSLEPQDSVHEAEGDEKTGAAIVLKALEEAPLWEPATKNGTPVASEGVLRIQLPEGKPLPRLPELIWR